MMKDYVIPTKNEKSYEDHREHFIFRLKERHGIELNNDEFDQICKNKRGIYRGKFKKNGYRSIGILHVKGVPVLVNYYSTTNCFTTALPISNIDSPQELIQTCFSRPIRHLAYMILDTVHEELQRAQLDKFDSVKEMALYYQKHHIFSNLAINQYKRGCVDHFQIMRAIRDILYGRYRYARLVLLKSNKEQKQERSVARNFQSRHEP